MRFFRNCGVAAALLTLSIAPLYAAECDPYTNHACLNSYLGDGVFTRMLNYYRLEMGRPSAPADPNAPPARCEGWPATPLTTPPMPFTEWPYGGSQNLGVTRPGSADSPLMMGIGGTALGRWMSSANLQLYGWVNGGFNVSTNSQQPGGNAPIAYAYTPNTLQLDQAVVYLERVPDTVQSDHVDWGFRISALYGETYRYTLAYGLVSGQYLNHNNVSGYDFPMVYLEVFVPQIARVAPISASGDSYRCRISRRSWRPTITCTPTPSATRMTISPMKASRSRWARRRTCSCRSA